ncbi:MAG TPA: bifunctional riboflavin kinase/FAD synthetase [Candidatus Binatia bacterium]|nr:bifunctional riboflavin kinase/FAD synthetase [Candidatus Binatia bacterium]
MQVIRHLEASRIRFESPVATLGNFDGVHIGHQEILARVVHQAAERRGNGVVITFFPHPAAVLAPERAPALLMPLRERLGRMREAGVATVVLQHFTRAFAALEAAEFVERYLVRRLGVAKVIIGHSVNFGRGRGGNAATLEEAGRRFGFEVEVVGPVTADGIAVSSSEVRKCLSAGDIRLGARLLGRTYAVEGRVIVGDRRGRGFGFPTANLRPRSPILVPDGVYAVRAEWGAEQRGGVANVGRKPTFGKGHLRTLEAHLFDFDGDLYGERLRVSFVERLRGEVRFPSPQALVEQIGKDAERAREVLRI